MLCDCLEKIITMIILTTIIIIMTIIMTKKLLNTSINRAVLNLCLADLLVILVDVPLTTVILIANHEQLFLVSRIL